MPRLRTLNHDDRALRLLEFIKFYKAENDGLSPSMREMAAELHTSTSVVHYYLDKLEDFGKIRRTELMSRGIMVIGGRWECG